MAEEHFSSSTLLACASFQGTDMTLANSDDQADRMMVICSACREPLMIVVHEADVGAIVSGRETLARRDTH